MLYTMKARDALPIIDHGASQSTAEVQDSKSSRRGKYFSLPSCNRTSSKRSSSIGNIKNYVDVSMKHIVRTQCTLRLADTLVCMWQRNSNLSERRLGLGGVMLFVDYHITARNYSISESGASKYP